MKNAVLDVLDRSRH